MTKDQIITDKYAIYNSDNVYIMQSLPDQSIDFSVYSPPFAKKNGGALYNYSSSPHDLSNSETLEQFLTQYEYMVKEKARIHKAGTITAVHCTDTMDTKTEVLFDFPHEIISIHERYGFEYKNRITVWKEPLKVRMRTMVRSLMHKMIVEDSSNCFTASPDYVLIFKKKGQREVPVTHPVGLKHYAGELPLLHAHLDAYGIERPITPIWDDKAKKYSMTSAIEGYVAASFENLKKKYEDHKDPKTNKLSHIIWQRYASSTWDDVRIDNVLPFRESKEEEDEKHVHPLQLDVYDRLIELYTNPGETVLEPYLGVGSGAYSAVSMDRKAIGIELKESYFRQAIKNLAFVNKRFIECNQKTILDEINKEGAA